MVRIIAILSTVSACMLFPAHTVCGLIFRLSSSDSCEKADGEMLSYVDSSPSIIHRVTENCCMEMANQLSVSVDCLVWYCTLSLIVLIGPD